MQVSPAFRHRRGPGQVRLPALRELATRGEVKMTPGEFGVFQYVLNHFQAATTQWLGELYAVGLHLFWMIAAIEIVLLGITNALRRDWEYPLIDLARPAGGIGAMDLLLHHGPAWLQHGLSAAVA